MNVRDAPAIGQSVEYVKGLVQEEIEAGTPANRIVIGGFSQVGPQQAINGKQLAVNVTCRAQLHQLTRSDSGPALHMQCTAAPAGA